ncbi:FolE GTP cyclohydrolase I [uncultured Caudovirales phage]|uniref:GTP cyclohydrolase I n=1 Tax=uncultured Caudovirales phage TaxID=2100421 RepID=A0A6J5KX42_9CAUD|nr:FolE GTP cyclohydrolase I [uncultured Caudovirales phage]
MKKELVLLEKANGNMPRTSEEKLQMIDQAAVYYGQFLNALGFDWEKDPHSANTPKRVAKAWINDLIAGSVGEEPVITSFPNDEGYTGLICQTRIPVMSMCAHHNLTFSGVAHVAYIPGKEKTDLVVGLSKLNRIVDFYSRRPNIQESLTKQIHDHIDKLCIGNRGVAVVVESQHNCVRCRGIKQDSIMKTSQMSGYFFDNEIGTRQEFFSLIDNSRV